MLDSTVQEMVRQSQRQLSLIPTTIPVGTVIPSMVNVKEEPRWTISQWEYRFPPEPFDISLGEFLQLEYDDIVKLQVTVRRKCSQLIEDAWKKGKRQVVVCDGQIVFSTDDSEDIPNEEIRALAERYNKPCYTFTSPDPVEESGWTVVDADDHYPTLGLYIGSENAQESSLPKNFYPLDADFDTGNPSLKVFDANQLGAEISKFEALDLRRGEHLGKPYTYFQKKLKLCAKDDQDGIHSIVARVRLVQEWAGCGLLQVSPNRIGFVGRDMLRLLGIRVELDPITKVTRILGASSDPS